MEPSDDVQSARDAAQKFAALMTLLSVPEPILDIESVAELVEGWSTEDLKLVVTVGASICTEILRSITGESSNLTDSLMRYVAKLALEAA
jgi:hypothetical protein